MVDSYFSDVLDFGGALESPYDPNDHIYEALAEGDYYIAEMPEEFDLRPFLLNARDQGNRGTCAAFAGATMRELIQNRVVSKELVDSPTSINTLVDTSTSVNTSVDAPASANTSVDVPASVNTSVDIITPMEINTTTPTDLVCNEAKKQMELMNVLTGGSSDVTPLMYMSPEFLYWHRDNKPSSGMYGRNVFQIMQKVGCVPEALYKYKNRIKPTQDLYNVAEIYKIPHYSRVTSLQGLKRALLEQGPCYMQLPLYNNGVEFWKKQDPSDNVHSTAHAVTVVGYTKNGFIVRNSWGSDWNKSGYVVLPFDDWPIVKECWVITSEAGTPPSSY